MRRSSRPAVRRAITRAALIISAAAFLLWFSTAVSLAGVFRNANPAAAMSLGLPDARAKASLAEKLIAAAENEAALDKAAELARSALARDATVGEAARSLGFIAGGKGRLAEAKSSFSYAERISRRDIATQLWLIELRVRRNDIDGALRHYDRALRTSFKSREILLPVLAKATAEPALLAPLVSLLVTRPPWQERFYEWLVEVAPSASNAVTLIERVGRSADLPDAETLRRFVANLVQRGEYESAARIYDLLDGTAGPHAQGITNGDFEQHNAVPPFDWEIESGVTFGAEQQRREDGEGGQGLRAFSTTGRGGVAARQLLMLKPGRYQLSWIGFAAADSRPAELEWILRCARNQRHLANSSVSMDRQIGRQHLSFEVTAECEGQWLNLAIQGDMEPGGASGWVDEVRLTQAVR